MLVELIRENPHYESTQDTFEYEDSLLAGMLIYVFQEDIEHKRSVACCTSFVGVLDLIELLCLGCYDSFPFTITGGCVCRR